MWIVSQEDPACHVSRHVSRVIPLTSAVIEKKNNIQAIILSNQIS
jgi:hypothetical protein